MDYPRKKGKLPHSSDSGRGAFAVQIPRRSHGCSNSIKTNDAVFPPEPFRREKEECTKEVPIQATETEANICNDSHVVDNRPRTLKHVHPVRDQQVSKTLREKGKLPPSSDSSPGAFRIQESRAPLGSGRPPRPVTAMSPRLFLLHEEEFKKDASAKASDAESNIYSDTRGVKNGPDAAEGNEVQDGSRNLRTKGRLPPSSDSSPGAFPIQSLRSSHGAHDTRPPAAPTPPELFTLDEEEYREEVVAPAAETEGNLDSDRNDVENTRDTVEAYALGEPVYAEILNERSRKWRERPLGRAISVASCLFLVVGVVVLVMYLTKSIGGTSDATPPPSTPTPPSPPVTPEEIACIFIGQPSLSGCRNKISFDRSDGDIANGTTIPGEIGLLTQLTRLCLDDNELSGSIPSSISQLIRLNYLSFIDNKLTGSIPPSLSTMTSLTQLNFDSNELTGRIPPSLSNLTLLTWLSFDSNGLNGSIPSSLSKLTLLTSLSFDDNRLTGSIPPSLSNLTQLNGLSFSDNLLTGGIPPSLSKLTLLEGLYFEKNQLTGSIPSSLSNLISLQSASFEGNELTGSIPSSLCNQFSFSFVTIDCAESESEIEIECSCCECV